MDEKGLYIHIPFCRRKCPYCDFFSLAGGSFSLRQYVDLLCKNIEVTRCDRRWGGPFDTIFFGGGTPSLLDPSDIGHILDTVRNVFGFSCGAEVSLEANPGTVTLESLGGYRAAGVNRISFGVQSLDPDNLGFLGRIHSAQDAVSAVTLARRAGFENISCDLIFGLPMQTMSALESDLRCILELKPEHLSCYALTFEEGTPLHLSLQDGTISPPDEDEVASQFLLLHDTLEGYGYSHYEISNYARPGFECRHNLLYWRRCSCLGIGAGAHSFCAAGWGERRAVPSDLDAYAADIVKGASPSRLLEKFDHRGAMAETLYLGLRTSEGVSDAAFRKRFGIGVSEAFPHQVVRHRDYLGLISGSWRFTPAGWLLFDHIIADFL